MTKKIPIIESLKRHEKFLDSEILRIEIMMLFEKAITKKKWTRRNKKMATHTNPRKAAARQLAQEIGCSVRTAYRKINDAAKREENDSFDYEAETPRGEWI